MALQEYPIQEGQHRSGCYFSPFRCKQIMSGQFMFSDNSWYDRDALNDDLNKLCGFSYLHHHWQSARLAWRPSTVIDGAIELWLYSYQRGERTYQKITTVRVAESYKFSLLQLHTGTMGAVVGNRNQLTATEEIKGPVTFPYIGYVLYPYFGGDKPAPKNHTVYLDFRMK